MEPEVYISIFQNALFLILTISGAIILPSLCIGLCVSVFQAATSINEQTLSFLPRLVTTILTMAFLGNWITRLVMDFSYELIRNIPLIIK